MHPLCAACKGACCYLLVPLIEEDLSHVPEELREQNEAGQWFMKRQKTGACVALKDGLCTIYENRPKVCRDFQVGSYHCESARNRRRNEVARTSTRTDNEHV